MSYGSVLSQSPVGLDHGCLPLGQLTFTSLGFMQFMHSGQSSVAVLAGDVMCFLLSMYVNFDSISLGRLGLGHDVLR